MKENLKGKLTWGTGKAAKKFWGIGNVGNDNRVSYESGGKRREVQSSHIM